MANSSILADLNLPVPSPTLSEKIVAPLETFYGTIGAITPMQRFIVTSLIVAAVEFVAEPSFAFNADGSTRPSTLVSSQRDATVLHWTVLPILAGAASALFV